MLFLGVLLVPVTASGQEVPAGAQEAPAETQEAPAWRTLQNETVERPLPYEARVQQEGGLVREISLEDAIRLALINNLELEIENYNEELTRERIIQTRGFYDPRLRFSFGWRSAERPSTSVLDAGQGIPTNISKNWIFDTEVQQNVPGGGSLSLLFQSDRVTTNSAFSFINPRYGSDFQVQFVQPLWRGFLETETNRQLKLYNLDSEISDRQFEQRVSEVIQSTENEYWELVFALENYEARRQSMELAILQFENNKRRSSIGVLAPIEITSSRAEVASRNQDMIQVEVQIINSENALKRLLTPNPQDSLWDVTLIPTDRPLVRDVTVSFDEAVDAALQRRPELEQTRLRMEQNEVDRSYYQKQGKPAVNLRTSFLSTGTAGVVFQDTLADLDGDGVPETRVGREPNPDSVFFGNFSETVGQVFGLDFRTYDIAVDVWIPLRNRTNDAQLAQVAISDRQLRSQLRNIEQEILVEVRDAYQSLGTQRKRLEAARLTTELTREQLEGETKRFQAGLSTNFEVLRYQRDLADARVRELRALVDYEQALTSLQKAMYTIIDDSDIVLARGD